MSNIFSLYLENGKQVPFVVHRSNWSNDYGLVVLSATITNKRGPYGTAVGFGLPPLNGEPYTDRWGTADEPKEINCAGCWQWRMAEEIPPEWSAIIAATEPK